MGVGAIAWDSTDRHVVAAGLRNQLELACDLLAERETGLLLTLDEVHQLAHQADLRDVFVAVQHLFRNDREIAVAAAGLPSAISNLLNDEVLTFLRRADRHTLGQIESDEVERALRATVEGAAGRSAGQRAGPPPPRRAATRSSSSSSATTSGVSGRTNGRSPSPTSMPARRRR